MKTENLITEAMEVHHPKIERKISKNIFWNFK
jgi:hypothetical protein